MAPKLVNVFKSVGFHVLCVIYTFYTIVLMLIAYVTKGKTIFETKQREQPEQLKSNEYGVHKYMQVNDVKLHYVEKGDPSKPLIVFVHGFPEFWYSWRYQLKEFGKDYWTIAIDQRGYGDSEKPAGRSNYHIEKMVDDIRELVRKLGREKFILIGHDWGAAVGFHYVRKYMDTIDKYVMIGGPPPEVWKRIILKSVKQFFMSWYIFFFLTPYLPELLISLSDFKIFDVMKVGNKDEVECYKYVFSKPGALTPPINYYRAIRVLYPDEPLSKPKRCAPGLFMLGEYDKYIARVVGKYAKEDFDKLEFKLIPEANHFAQQHKPDKTNQMIREFLDKK